MVLKIGLIKALFSKGARTLVQEAPQTQSRMTRVFTDSSTGIVKMERKINRNGKEALATLEVLPDGKRKLTIEGGGDNTIWRTTQITRENGASVFGGDKITIDKDYTKYWCYGEKTNLVKEYNPQGVLEHKELNYHKNIGNETFINHKSVQDRVYDEYPLNGGYRDMLTNPNDTRYVKHTLDNKNNYHRFADGSSTNYTRTVQANEQAAIDSAKRAEAEALAAQKAEAETLAAKKTAEDAVRAKQPRINIAQVLNKDINELKVQEIKLTDGTIERIFTDPASGKVLAKTQDNGLFHTEWIYGGKADMIYMRQVGNDTPYIVAKKGNYTQVSYEKDCGYHPFEKEHVHKQYYYDGDTSLERGYTASGLYNDARGRVTVFDKRAENLRKEYPDAANYYPDYQKVGIQNGRAYVQPYYEESYIQKEANRYMSELNADAERNFIINFDNLFSGYIA